jgi:phosphoribosyl 1,2-cyclic phosphate phosphodiesterase
MPENTFCFLGTGGSLGVPIVGCTCSTCLSLDSKNKRTRSGNLINWQGKTFLLDAGPDYRQQALQKGINKLDGFILTHAHYDHMGGFDDLRAYPLLGGNPLPCIMLEKTFEELELRYPYLLKRIGKEPRSRFFSWKTLESPSGFTTFEGMEFEYFSFLQMGMEVMGLKIGSIAYVSDIKEYGEDLIEKIKETETLIVSALRKSSSPMHFSVEDALEFIKKVQPTRAYLTHIAHELDHEALLKELPPHVFIAYDGLTISF